jgi:hypothetical protein
MSWETCRLGRLGWASLIFLAACQAEDRMAPPDQPGVPPPNLAPYAYYLDIDVIHSSVTVVPPQTFSAQASGRVANSLAGAEIVEVTASNFVRSKVGDVIPKKRTITFDLTLTNKLSVTDLVTPTLPKPPAGVQGIIAFPYTVVVSGSQGERANPNSDWNGDGTANPGTPFNFFNDFASCGTAVTSDCYRWEAFPSPLRAGESTAPQKVGFTVDPTVTNIGVYVIVAADLLDHPPVPPMGILKGTVSSPQQGMLTGDVLLLDATSAVIASTQTDQLGNYSFTNPSVSAAAVKVTGLALPCAPTAQVPVSITAGVTTIANITVDCPSGIVSGTVTSPLGALAGEVSLSSSVGATATAHSDVTTGIFGPINFPVGTVTGTLAQTGLPSICQAGPAQSDNLAINSVVVLNLTADCPGDLIGRVTNAFDVPLSGVTIAFTGSKFLPSAQTNADGYYAFPVNTGLHSAVTDIMVSGPPGCGGPFFFRYSGESVLSIRLSC